MLSVSRLLTGTRSDADPLRYGRRSGRLPAHLLHYSEDKKPVIVWTSTRRCNLHCAHCYTDSRDRPYEGELSTAEARRMIDQVAAFGAPVLLISGGEPLRRPDVLELAAHASAQGMRVVFSTNGTLITPAAAAAMKRAGVSYVGISVDGRRETHDRFRGQAGAFEASMGGIRHCQGEGIAVGLRYTITRENLRDLPWLFELMRERAVHRLCVYHLAPTGRGARIQDWAPSHEETRWAVDTIFDQTQALVREDAEVSVLTADNHADAPYLWMRVAREQPALAEETWRLLAWNGGNQSGRALAAINHDGEVYADQFWRWRPLGNVRERSFASIWEEEPDPLLTALRDRGTRLPERCQGCRFVAICNGNFRSRAEAVTGVLWGFDPLCYLTDEEIHGARGVAGVHV